jgi:hypothetical protein
VNIFTGSISIQLAQLQNELEIADKSSAALYVQYEIKWRRRYVRIISSSIIFAAIRLLVNTEENCSKANITQASAPASQAAIQAGRQARRYQFKSR